MKIITFSSDYLDHLDAITSKFVIDEDYDPETQIILYSNAPKCIKTIRTDGSKYYAIRCCDEDDIELIKIKEKTGSLPDGVQPNIEFIDIKTHAEAVKAFEGLTDIENKTMHIFYIVPEQSE
jgi:hypothetical protein